MLCCVVVRIKKNTNYMYDIILKLETNGGDGM
jgi:hypothetical protein